MQRNAAVVKNFLHLRLAIIAIPFILGGCSVLNAAKARMEPREQFIETQGYALVRYVQGAESMALRLGKAMDNSLNTVERMHGKAFLEPPKVFVCDADCFLRFSTLARDVPAAHFMDSIFMNDPELRRKERQFAMPPESFLVHELTHLLFYQHVGAISYMRTPAWFREGWAVVVSDGAGAQACSREVAARHLLAGNSFDPSEEGSLFLNKTASSYGLPYPVFYRQAAMFIEYLREVDPLAFQAALHDILDGEPFQNSFARAYSRVVASYWDPFKQSLKADFNAADIDAAGTDGLR
jgi:hypothetical protein